MAIVTEDWSERVYQRGAFARRVFEVIGAGNQREAEAAVNNHASKLWLGDCLKVAIPPLAVPIEPGRYRVAVMYASGPGVIHCNEWVESRPWWAFWRPKTVRRWKWVFEPHVPVGHN